MIGKVTNTYHITLHTFARSRTFALTYAGIHEDKVEMHVRSVGSGAHPPQQHSGLGQNARVLQGTLFFFKSTFFKPCFKALSLSTVLGPVLLPRPACLAASDMMCMHLG
jgi:hypothetical protein